MKLTLGTRGSELARTQSGLVADALRAAGHEVDLVTIRSEGDVTAGSLLDVGGLGVFAATLRVALLEGRVDLVVHSLKDLPTAPVPGLTLGAVPPRAEAADVLCARDGLTLATLPPGAQVGTGFAAPRRADPCRPPGRVRGRDPRQRRHPARPRALGPDADLDAVVLAAAGLDRLGRLDAATEALALLPAPGQGALAIECRADDAAVLAELAHLDSRATRAAVTAERAVLAALGAGCAAPIGTSARLADQTLALTAAVFSADGSASVRAERTASLPSSPLDAQVAAEALGFAVAGELLAEGAAQVTPLGASRPSELADFHHDRVLWAPGTRSALIGRRILLPRRDGALADAIRAAGADVDAVPVTRTEPLPFSLPGTADWLVLTSPTAVEVLAAADVDLHLLGDAIAAVGQATAHAITDAGAHADLVPVGRSDAEALLAALIDAEPDGATALIPGSALSRPALSDGLRAAGWDVERLDTYTTVPVTEAPAVRPWSDYDAVVLTSGSIAAATASVLGLPPEP
jgi:hydroxymethylbilane synthase